MFSLWIRYHSSRAFEKTYWKQTWRSKISLRSVWKRCYWCTLSDLKLHIKSKHEGVRYPCSHCEYVFTTAGNLKKHIKSKHGEWDIHVIIVTRARIPKIHIENKHEGVRYLFDQCEYVATDRSNLNKHLKITYKGSMQVCATTAWHLNRHIKNKHWAVRYPCNQCEYVATLSCQLKNTSKNESYLLRRNFYNGFSLRG